MTVLVTGGVGFIGSHLCESLLSNNQRVICLDNQGSGRRENIDQYLDAQEFELIEADVRNPIEETLLAESIEVDSIDQIYHLASRASPSDFGIHPIEIAMTNSQGTYNVLTLASKLNARVLFASTSEVYGDPEVHPQPEWYRGNVDPRGSRSCYQEGKRFGETLTVSFHEENELDVRTARIFNTYGPRMQPDGRIVPTLLTQALEDRTLTVYGDGTQTRCFLYVTDLVRGLRDLMDAPNLAGEVMNIGSTDEITINTLVELIIEMTETNASISYEPLPEDDPQRRQPDISKVKQHLDWKPTIGLEQGLEQTMLYLQNRIRVDYRD